MKIGIQQHRRSAGWSVTLVYVSTTVIVGMLLPRFERRYLPHWDSSISVGSAITIASSIASGMIALTGIVKSSGSQI